jgi:hypothetical protein
VGPLFSTPLVCMRQFAGAGWVAVLLWRDILSRTISRTLHSRPAGLHTSTLIVAEPVWSENYLRFMIDRATIIIYKFNNTHKDFCSYDLLEKLLESIL